MIKTAIKSAIFGTQSWNLQYIVYIYHSELVQSFIVETSVVSEKQQKMQK